MKYYCKNCGSEKRNNCDRAVIEICSFCESVDIMELVPAYETPAQYEKRTGKAYPDNGVIFFKNDITDWLIRDYAFAKNVGAMDIKDKRELNNIVVIADPLVPPPYDWKPEGEDDEDDEQGYDYTESGRMGG